MSIDQELEEKLEARVSRLSMILVVSVFSIKIINAFFTNSLGFYTELTDSITDFLLVTITFFALKKSRKPADMDHMFGHSKINSLAGILESIVTFVIYGIIAYVAILTLIDISRYTIRDPLYTTITLSIVVIINFFISGKIMKIGKETNNATIRAQAVNFRGDLFRNIAIIIGLIIALFGIYYFDPILALIFSIRSIYQSISVLRQGYNELMDYNAIDPDIVQELHQLIKDIDGISDVDDFALRTEGNSLYINLKISLEKFESLYSIQGIHELIKAKIKEFLPNYICNTLIQISSQKGEREYSELFDEIKYIVLKSEKIDEIHDISLDFLEDEILIQFHMLVNPLLKLSAAHDIATKIEEKIAAKLNEKLPNQKIEVISHIEPSEVKERKHYHNLPYEIPNSYNEIIRAIIDEIPQIEVCNNINLLQEEDGIYLTVKIAFKEDINVQEAHWIAEKLEFNLRTAIPNLKRCIIHPEYTC